MIAAVYYTHRDIGQPETRKSAGSNIEDAGLHMRDEAGRKAILRGNAIYK